MRTILPMREKEAQIIRPILRIGKPAAAYARRSDHKARDEEKDTSQSREMQTEDMIEWAIKQGWKERDVHEYFADLGLSGTLRPDQRPDMLRLFEDMDSGKFDHGSIICWQENRLFRDETQIYYNQFIQKCLAHDIVVVVVSPYLIIYDFRDEFTLEMFRWKQKESADFIKRHVKGWMLPARFRAAWIDGEWAGLGDPPTGFIIDFDEKSPTYKKLVPYWPHIEKVNEHFQLYVELGCNTGLLYERLRKSLIIFPEFEAWVDPRNVRRCKMSKYPGGGYYIKGKSGIVSLLTNPFYIGYRVINGVIRRNQKGEKIREFEPVIDQELFDLCYFRLAKTDLDGNPIAGRTTKRYYHRDSEVEYGLLKFRIRSNQGRVRVHPLGKYVEGKPTKGAYFIEQPENEHSLQHILVRACLQCDELEALIVERLMEHVREISKEKENIAEYENRAKKIRAERVNKVNQINSSMKDIEDKQSGLTISLGEVAQAIKEEQDTEQKEIKERRKQLIIEQIDRLELERRKLLLAKKTLEEEIANDIGSLDDELENLEASWPEYTFGKRRSLINFLIREVVVDTMSTHWVRVQVVWLHEAWGREEKYYWRSIGKCKAWTDEEAAIVKAHYPTMAREELQQLLPDRSWEAISNFSREVLGVKRAIGWKWSKYPNQSTSYSDLMFMQGKGIALSARETIWEVQSAQ